MKAYPTIDITNSISIDLPKKCPVCKAGRFYRGGSGAIYKCGGAYHRGLATWTYKGRCRADLEPSERIRSLAAVLEATYQRLLKQGEDVEALGQPPEFARLFCERPYLWKQYRCWNVAWLTLKKKMQLAKWFKGLSPKSRINVAIQSTNYFRKETRP